jgi:hypothetical protein
LCTAGGGVKFAAYAPAGSLAPVRTEEAMAYDAEIAERLRDAVMRVGPAGVVDERKMFGGVALLLDGSIVQGAAEGRAPEAAAGSLRDQRGAGRDAGADDLAAGRPVEMTLRSCLPLLSLSS